MHLLAESSARRILLLMLLASGAGSVAWGQFSNAYSSVPQHVQDQDAALHDARAKMLTDVSALVMPDMLQAANHGDAAAMRNLGCVYWDGLLAHDADADRGLQWFERAAVAGNIEAISMIGDHYATGADGKQDFALAKLWYSKGYVAKDARSTVGLAEMSCQGSGAPKNIARCGQLLDAASSFMKKGDALDVKPMVAESMFEIGGDYHAGIGTAKNQTLAAAWYAKSAALNRPSAAVAQSKLYVEPGGLPQNPVKATAVLDGYMKKFGPYPTFSDQDQKDFANTYAEIGKVYEKAGGAQMAAAIVDYRKAADLGYPDAILALAVRYEQGTGLPADLVMARSLLLGWNRCAREDPALWAQYDGAVAAFNAVVAAKGLSTPIGFYVPCPLAANETAEPDIAPPMPVQPRYPYIGAPDTATPQQKFPVMVSLNTVKIDSGTTIVSAPDQQNGELMISLPQGMTSILIEVDLVAPQMTATDGVLTKTIELTVNQNSTTAIFQMQAGTAPGPEAIFATLTYNGAFLATIQRDVTVAAKLTTEPVQNSVPAPTPGNGATLMLKSAAPTIVQGEPPRRGVPLDPEARAPDITIHEVKDGANVEYTVSSPLIKGFQQSVEDSPATRQAIVTKLYSDLEAQGKNLSLIHNANAIQQTKDFAAGQGANLYDTLAPAAFKTVYQKLEAMGAPPKTIEVLTDDPLLPWELMRPMGANGKREDFLGLTANVVRSVAALAPKTPPPSAEALDAIEVVMPTYAGDTALVGAQKELQAMQKSFPALIPVTGTVADVSALAQNLPDGIIHYAGHGIRVTTPGLPPNEAISLQGGTIVPATWLSLAESGTTHPFYFFNACDLGLADRVLDYVDGWAPKLIQSGASGYLGALWQISDTTAESFSAHFYADLKTKLAGKTPWSVADVVTQARQQTYAEQFDPTALAYVLYSAPYQTLANGDATAGANQ